MTDAPPADRPSTDVDRIADAYLDASLALNPAKATRIGAPGYDDQLTDYSPAGIAARLELDRRTLAQLAGAPAADSIDRVTVDAMQERLGVAIEISESGAEESDLNVISSPLQDVRSVFDLMPAASADDWAMIAARLRAVPAALAGYATSLTAAAARSDVSPRRQVEGVIGQCAAYGGDDGFFVTFAESARGVAGLPDALVDEVQTSARTAGAAYVDLGAFLKERILPHAPERDGCGREKYGLWSRAFVGAVVDFDEAYAWGQEELARISSEMGRLADQIHSGATVREAMEVLDNDPANVLNGTDELQAWMQDRADEAVSKLNHAHFEIPEPLRTIECRIAPTTEGGIYYTAPSDDFSRPGRMWWSVPKGVDQFTTWRELTTVYHEGVPGHHLQVGQTVYNRKELNRWRRLDCWVSGHGEGWALYAERLMEDLGFLDDPGSRLGMLDGQSLRAARVVLDIGVHLGLPAPAEVGGGDWDYDKAWAFLTAHSAMADGFLRFELDRYLGWPGQAPSYKLGERLWLQLRDEAKATAGRAGTAFDLKEFHRAALDIGSVPLDVLRHAVVG
ncbi:MAG: DUF885 domain-containing protein [Actinomycetota bacterium]|nr:DUF885 domain-containing protein [Actinomycetota bacterium]